MSVLLVSTLFIEGNSHYYKPVHFCICWCDSAVLTSYLFRQWPACMCVPTLEKCPGSQCCHKMCMVTSATYTVADIPPIGSGEMKRWNCTGKLLFIWTISRDCLLFYQSRAWVRMTYLLERDYRRVAMQVEAKQ